MFLIPSRGSSLGKKNIQTFNNNLIHNATITITTIMMTISIKSTRKGKTADSEYVQVR